MCGIVGILLKQDASRATLGEYLVPMFDCMADRGPDSAGLAVFSEAVPDPLRRFSLFSPAHGEDWQALADGVARHLGPVQAVQALDNHAVLIAALEPDRFRDWLGDHAPALRLLSVGRSIDCYKDQGGPSEIARRYRFAALRGTHGVGHTRMATESEVSPIHAHPFTAGEDFCLVHNGSLSNPYGLRRRLEAEGLVFETDNDTEAACRFIEWRMRLGETLDQAIGVAFSQLDGFYTLLIATRSQLTVVRDAFAAKPAVVAETDAYVAVSSEFRSLAHLPGIEHARLFEPGPEEIHSWQVPRPTA